jgi:hypothetical protein
MFSMMNVMRLGVGIQSVGVAERAYQLASAYARERVQGRAIDGAPTAIVGHPDVRRMLLTMKSLVVAARGLNYDTAAALDRAKYALTAAERAAAASRAGLLKPVAKSWCSDIAVEVTSLAMQLHGGMGFVEEAGISQLYRDARITPIFEGTNFIQAQDFVTRKVLRDGGRALDALMGEARTAAIALDANHVMREGLEEMVGDVENATRYLLAGALADPALVGSVAVDFLQSVAYTWGGVLWARMIVASRRRQLAGTNTLEFAQSTDETARFYATRVLPRAALHARCLRSGSAPVVNARVAAL